LRNKRQLKESNLKIEDLTAVIDSREQNPLPLDPLKTVIKKLEVADYSAVGYENKIAIEKKSLNDLCACVGRERERFDRMVKRLLNYEYRAIVVTDDWSKIDLKQYHGTLTPIQIYSAIMAWAMTAQVPIMFMGSHQRAGLAVARMIYIAVNRERRKFA